MPDSRYRFINPIDTKNYRELLSGMSSACWPEFMQHDPIADQLWEHLFSDFPEYQFALFDSQGRRVAAMANSLPLNWEDDPTKLPETGWDWAFQQAVADHAQVLQPHTQCAIQIAIHPDYRGQGLSSVMVAEMRKIGQWNSFRRLIAPVRPNQKSLYPLIEIDRYINWTTPDGLPFDAWLRVHVRAGARLSQACHRAMEIHGKREEWQAWTGMDFPGSGEYILPGGLVPMKMDVEADHGVYIEPNVWTVHDLDKSRPLPTSRPAK